MVEQSIKFLYLGAAVVLFTLAIASFYQQEKRFITYVDALQSERSGKNWLKTIDLRMIDMFYHDRGISAVEKGALTDFQKVDQGKTFIMDGETLRSWIYGTLLYENAENWQLFGTTLHGTVQDIVQDDTLLALNVPIFGEGVRLLPSEFSAFMNQLQKDSLYGVEYHALENSYVISHID